LILLAMNLQNRRPIANAAPIVARKWTFRAPGQRGENPGRYLKSSLPMGTMTADCKNTETSVRRRLSGSSSIACTCVYIRKMETPEIKNNRTHALLRYGPRFIHLFRV